MKKVMKFTIAIAAIAGVGYLAYKGLKHLVETVDMCNCKDMCGCDDDCCGHTCDCDCHDHHNDECDCDAADVVNIEVDVAAEKAANEFAEAAANVEVAE